MLSDALSHQSIFIVWIVHISWIVNVLRLESCLFSALIVFRPFYSFGFNTVGIRASCVFVKIGVWFIQWLSHNFSVLFVDLVLLKLSLVHFPSRRLWRTRCIFVSWRTSPSFIFSFVVSGFWSLLLLFWPWFLVSWWAWFSRLWPYFLVSGSRSTFSFFFGFFSFWFFFKIALKTTYFWTRRISISVIKSSLLCLILCLFIWLHNSNMLFLSVNHF